MLLKGYKVYFIWGKVYVRVRVAQKASHYQIIKKSYQILLKPTSDIKFLRQIKVSIKRHNIIRSY